MRSRFFLTVRNPFVRAQSKNALMSGGPSEQQDVEDGVEDDVDELHPCGLHSSSCSTSTRTGDGMLSKAKRRHIVKDAKVFAAGKREGIDVGINDERARVLTLLRDEQEQSALLQSLRAKIVDPDRGVISGKAAAVALSHRVAQSWHLHGEGKEIHSNVDIIKKRQAAWRAKHAVQGLPSIMEAQEGENACLRCGCASNTPPCTICGISHCSTCREDLIMFCGTPAPSRPGFKLEWREGLCATHTAEADARERHEQLQREADAQRAAQPHPQCTSIKVRIPHYPLPTTHNSLLTTHYSLLTTHYPLLTTHYSLLILTTHYSLLTTPYLTTHCSLLTTHY